MNRKITTPCPHGYVGWMHVKGERGCRRLPEFGPQPPPNDPRIFKGTPSEFFERAAETITKTAKEAPDGPDAG